MPRIIQRLEPRHRAVWGRHTVKLRHGLTELDLFSDEVLAALLDTYDEKRLIMHTMADDVSTWKSVARGGVSGRRILDAVRSGRVWINMTDVQDADPRFRELLDAIYAEWAREVPGFNAFKRKIGLLVSSPNARVFYHCDPAGQALWQVRGRKRIYLYPPAPPFLQPAELENVIRSVTAEELSYQPWYDDHAEVYDLEPGQMLHWALNCPHRIDNHDEINVSLTSEHFTPEILRRWAVNYGNGVLRSLGYTPRSRSVHGAAFWTKVAVTTLWRATVQERQSYKRVPEFVPDPDAPNGVRPIAAAGVS
ncbi:cupin-like domain-containing protein [Pseudonocardia acaciae]|uniref:cupin-like domain-containing protein n=1 Tax=Pseudonocardia acaciae TaxID=551276 RepID=UPI000688904C|nr:cupin-like domain-containing protein [Pseudonocardia acaciae]